MFLRPVSVILILTFILTIISITWMGIARQPLVIPGKTQALFSLETAFTRERVEAVRSAWSHQLEYAQKVNNIDFFFLGSYSLFFLFSVLWLIPIITTIRFSARILLSMIAVTFVFDIFEGIATHYWLKGLIDPVSPALVAVTAIIKFVFAGVILSILLIAYIQAASRWINQQIKKPARA